MTSWLCGDTGAAKGSGEGDDGSAAASHVRSVVGSVRRVRLCALEIQGGILPSCSLGDVGRGVPVGADARSDVEEDFLGAAQPKSAPESARGARRSMKEGYLGSEG
eukprot:1257934-Rhodomonas_salina.11